MDVVMVASADRIGERITSAGNVLVSEDLTKESARGEVLLADASLET